MKAPVYTFRDARLRSPLLRAVNTLGRGLAAFGLSYPRLGQQQIVEAARQRAGSLREPDAQVARALRVFLESVEADANLNTFGRIAVQNMLVGGLSSWMSVLDFHAEHPAVGEESIERPWVIIGLPRTGTSILSILLGLDPLNRPLLQWEARHPIPPADLAGAQEDPRITQLSAEFGRLQKLNPAAATMHPFGSTLAEECTALFMYALRTIGLETLAYTPTYGNWLDEADMEPAYSIHRQTLQALQSAQPVGHWVLKSPNHLWCLPALLNAYPDARIIWTHRDPSNVLPSLASLNCALQIQFTRKLNAKAVGEYWASKVETAIASATKFDGQQQPGWCQHIQYSELLANPIDCLEGIYAQFGDSLGALHRQRIDAWLRQRPQHAEGVHAYDASDFGWSEAALQQRFQRYRERYVEPT